MNYFGSTVDYNGDDLDNICPDIVEGIFAGPVTYGAGELAGDTGGNSNMHVGVTYSAEDLTVMANYIKNKGNNAVNDSFNENEKSAVGAKYTMGDIKLA